MDWFLYDIDLHHERVRTGMVDVPWLTWFLRYVWDGICNIRSYEYKDTKHCDNSGIKFKFLKFILFMHKKKNTETPKPNNTEMK